MRVLFLHPDLGIGGAERLVCDAALALKAKGHKVSFFTTYHDPEHCFPETRDGTFPGAGLTLFGIIFNYYAGFEIRMLFGFAFILVN